MGKYSKNIFKVKDDLLFFDVLVSIHGKKPHTERYSILEDHFSVAKELGYFSDSGNKTYFDWKPMEYTNFFGGVYKVEQFYFDDRYVYAATYDQMFRLPKYLFNKLPNKEYILVGKRVK